MVPDIAYDLKYITWYMIIQSSYCSVRRWWSMKYIYQLVANLSFLLSLLVLWIYIVVASWTLRDFNIRLSCDFLLEY